LRLLLLIGLIWIISQPASAQTPSDCQSIVVRDARLSCYDKLFPPNNRPPDTLPDVSGQNKTQISAPAETTILDYSWADVAGCKRIAKAPAFRFYNLPANAHSVSLLLTKGDREFGGQEVELPANGIVQEGSITMEGPCAPGNYRWTATIKSATGVILAVVHLDRWFPVN